MNEQFEPSETSQQQQVPLTDTPPAQPASAAPAPLARTSTSTTTAGDSGLQTSRVQNAASHGWLGTQTLETRVGAFAFRNGYPTPETAEQLHGLLTLNRAVEVYLTQLPAVSIIDARRGARAFGAERSHQVIIWESLMDSATLVLTGNTETVYAMGFLDLRGDGPTVVEAPPKMLGVAMDTLQRFLVDIGPLGPDQGAGGKYLFLPPDYTGEVPAGYFVVHSPTYSVSYFLRGFLVDGKPDQAVALIQQLKVYPLAQAAHPPTMQFLNGSEQPIDTIYSDNVTFFEELAQLVHEEPAEVFSSLERFQMQALGIAHGAPFAPDAGKRALLEEAARLGGAMARANTYDSRDPQVRFYSDRQWLGFNFGDMPYTFVQDGIVQVDRRAYAYYMAVGNSPAMLEKHVGVGSQYLWVTRDQTGSYLDGAKSYRLHIPPNVPVNNFWSVVVYDAQSRSLLQNGTRFPSVSQYSGPTFNADGSVDITFGPMLPAGWSEKNFVKTVPGTGWFALFRFYGALPPYFDQTWKLEDLIEVH